MPQGKKTSKAKNTTTKKSKADKEKEIEKKKEIEIEKEKDAEEQEEFLIEDIDEMDLPTLKASIALVKKQIEKLQSELGDEKSEDGF